MRPDLVDVLRCPDHYRPLRLTGETAADGDVLVGELRCALGHAFPIVAGIPRFVPEVADSTTRKVYDHLWVRKAYGPIGWDGLTEGEPPEQFVRARLALPPRPQGLAVDLGCGDGRHAAALAATGLDVIALDISTAGVEIGRAHAPAVDFVQGDLLAVPLRDAVADVVFACGSLHHAENPRAAFNHAVRVLRPGGRFYVWLYDAAPNGHAPLLRVTSRAPYVAKRFVAVALTMANRLRRRFGRENPVTTAQTVEELAWWTLDEIGPEFRHLVPLDEMMAWLEAAGFEGITVRDRMTYGYGVYARRRVAFAERLEPTSSRTARQVRGQQA
jgi:SAM-dependent methyltransferase